MGFVCLCQRLSAGRHTSHAEQSQHVNINMFDHGHALRAVLPTLGAGGGDESMHANTTAQGLCQKPLLYGGEKRGGDSAVSTIEVYRLYSFDGRSCYRE
jgi:hypothetical protein